MKARRQRQLDPASRGEALAPKAAQMRPARFVTALKSLATGAPALGFLTVLADLGGPAKIAARTSARAFFGSQGLRP